MVNELGNKSLPYNPLITNVYLKTETQLLSTSVTSKIQTRDPNMRADLTYS
jgi:hypothetical protein